MHQLIQFIKCWKCGEINRLMIPVDQSVNFHCENCDSGILKQEVVKGYIYILSNPFMKGLLKIGYTERTPEERLVELQSTGVPSDFVLECTYFSKDPAGDEKVIHERLDKYRVNKKREFFEVELEFACKVIDEYCQLR